MNLCLPTVALSARLRGRCRASDGGGFLLPLAKALAISEVSLRTYNRGGEVLRKMEKEEVYLPIIALYTRTVSAATCSWV